MKSKKLLLATVVCLVFVMAISSLTASAASWGGYISGNTSGSLPASDPQCIYQLSAADTATNLVIGIDYIPSGTAFKVEAYGNGGRLIGTVTADSSNNYSQYARYTRYQGEMVLIFVTAVKGSGSYRVTALAY